MKFRKIIVFVSLSTYFVVIIFNLINIFVFNILYKALVNGRRRLFEVPFVFCPI